MKKILLVLVSFLLSLTIVNADENGENNTCSNVTKTELMKYASNVVVTYEEETVEVERYIEGGEGDEGELATLPQSYLNIKIYNINSKINVIATNLDSKEKFNVTYKYIGTDGAVTIRRKLYNQLGNYKFEVYGANECSSEVLRTMKLTLPRYNFLADMDMCSDIQDYYLCQRLVTYDIDTGSAYALIDEYKESLAENDLANEKTKEEEGTSTRIINKISNNKSVVVIVVLVIGVILTVFILIRRRKER